MAETTGISWTEAEIERDARAFLNRARMLTQVSGDYLTHCISETDFETLVQQEVALTLRQLRKSGRKASTNFSIKSKS